MVTGPWKCLVTALGFFSPRNFLTGSERNRKRTSRVMSASVNRCCPRQHQAHVSVIATIKGLKPSLGSDVSESIHTYGRPKTPLGGSPCWAQSVCKAILKMPKFASLCRGELFYYKPAKSRLQEIIRGTNLCWLPLSLSLFLL